jgi:hypothetical protein
MVVNRLAGVLEPYKDAVEAAGGIYPSVPISAGEVFGEQRENMMDFSLHDGAAWLSGFAHPFAYATGFGLTPYTVDPLPYLPPTDATAYEAKMQRVVPPRSGKIDLDVVGTAAGSWFLEGTLGSGWLASVAATATKIPTPEEAFPGKNYSTYGHLAVVPHYVQPSVWIASIGMWADPAGDFRQFAIMEGPPRPNAITPADGIVVYELSNWSSLTPDGYAISTAGWPVGFLVVIGDMVKGVLAVRVNGDNTLTVEPRPDLTSAAGFTGFSSAARTYWR